MNFLESQSKNLLAVKLVKNAFDNMRWCIVPCISRFLLQWLTCYFGRKILHSVHNNQCKNITGKYNIVDKVTTDTTAVKDPYP